MPGAHRRIGDALRPAGRGARLAVLLAVLVLAGGAGVGAVLGVPVLAARFAGPAAVATAPCLLYTSDAADE